VTRLRGVTTRATRAGQRAQPGWVGDGAPEPDSGQLPQQPEAGGAACSFRLTTRRAAHNTAIVHVNGEIDLLTAPELESEITAQLCSGGRTLVLDLREVSFLGCTGLRVLLTARDGAARSRTALSLVYQSPAVERPLALLGLTRLFHRSTDMSDIYPEQGPVSVETDRWQR
jgi:anti-sigma B factor antagonist